MLLLGNCLEKVKELEDNSVDAVVTDPPYGLKFMNKHWDYDVPSVEIWKEVFRVLKPGGHLLSFGGTRTYHRMAVNIEDAGFEIRDQIQWLYGSGFPKSHDVSKAIDKAAGAEREIIGKKSTYREPQFPNGWDCTKRAEFETKPSTDLAKQWQGWGSALKPANEPICMARKPLEKGLTIAENVLKWGTGAINIDGNRIEGKPRTTHADENVVTCESKTGHLKGKMPHGPTPAPEGRWPANIILDEQAAELVGQSSRFFYVAKASRGERNAGLENEEKQKQGARPNSADASGKFPDHDHRASGGNNHPTVKPTKLMKYLIKLITPPNGIVLDPFMGSGSTGVAAKQLGFKFIGIELSPEYFEIAQKRIESANEV